MEDSDSARSASALAATASPASRGAFGVLLVRDTRAQGTGAWWWWGRYWCPPIVVVVGVVVGRDTAVFGDHLAIGIAILLSETEVDDVNWFPECLFVAR
jgi:hypothetical protein